MKKELSIKDLQHYPLDNLQVLYKDKIYNVDYISKNKIVSEDSDSLVLNEVMLIRETKPILRPMSDLTKEIEFEGKIVVPIIEIFKKTYASIKDINIEYLRCSFNKKRTVAYAIYEDEFLRIELCYDFKYSLFEVTYTCEPCAMYQYIAFETLYEMLFDIRDLISQGLAIDINTLKP